MAPQAAAVADANVLPELWETIHDVDRFMCHQAEMFHDALEETLDTLTNCSPVLIPDPQDDRDVSSMKVLGIFARDKKPREEELPEYPPLSACAKDQVMCRRPLTEPATFVPEQGLVGSDFYHVTVLEDGESDDEEEESDDEEDDDDWDPRIYEERAVLIQAVEHYETLQNEPSLAKYFENEHVTSSCLEEDILKTPRFGEQLMVRGMDASQVAIGDVFEVKDGLSPLKMEVSSPRLCCAYVDKRNGSVFGMAGVKRHCNTHGLGGIFARVLVAGELTDNMMLVRTANPNPKWTMEYVSQTLYGEGPKRSLMKNEAHWSRSKEELKELCELPGFGRYEWRDEAKYILRKWNKYHPEDSQQEKASCNALSVLSMNDLFLPFMSGFPSLSSHWLGFGEIGFFESLSQYYSATVQKVDALTDFLVSKV